MHWSKYRKIALITISNNTFESQWMGLIQWPISNRNACQFGKIHSKSRNHRYSSNSNSADWWVNYQMSQMRWFGDLLNSKDMNEPERVSSLSCLSDWISFTKEVSLGRSIESIQSIPTRQGQRIHFSKRLIANFNGSKLWKIKWVQSNLLVLDNTNEGRE